ncbi:MAG: hypothetical protein LBC97_10885 [Bifidobacteriaceae bacterium]|nr:hypothetical protein [Bifidobacteriaceae bacterium]
MKSFAGEPRSWAEVDFRSWFAPTAGLAEFDYAVGLFSRDPDRASLLDPPLLDRVMAEHAEALIAADSDPGVMLPGVKTFRRLARSSQFRPWFVIRRAWERLGRLALPHDDDCVLALVGLGSWAPER